MLIDTHCHLDDQKLNNEQVRIIENLKADGVELAITSSASISESFEAVALAEKYSNIYATVGIHPQFAGELDESVRVELEKLAYGKKVIAIGEIGLDYHYDGYSKEVQIKAMTDQILLANKLGLPVVFHVRDAMGDFLQIVRAYKAYLNNGAVVHSFSGSVEVAKELTSYGFMLGINGICTFKNASNILEVIKEIPLKYLLLETDAPYLTPEPFRGKVNEPRYTIYMANKVADIKGVSVGEVIEETNKNAKRIYTKIGE